MGKSVQYNRSFILFLIPLLTTVVTFASCVDVYDVAQENFKEDFQRKFRSQLELIENQNIGCLFDKDVCSLDDLCYDDGLFGTCIALYTDRPHFAYRLPGPALRDLKSVLAGLVARNFSWRDRYSQCCVRAALICTSMEIPINLAVCKPFADGATRDTEIRAQRLLREREMQLGRALVTEMMTKEAKRLAVDAWTELSKRLELLNRNKYTRYSMDIPEKKTVDRGELDQLESDPPDSPAVLEESRRDEPSRDARLENELLRLSSAPANRVSLPRAVAPLKHRQEINKRRQTPVDKNMMFVDGAYLWLKFPQTSSLESSQVLVFIARVNQIAGKVLLENKFSVNSTGNEIYFQLGPRTSPHELRRLLGNETTAVKLRSNDKFNWVSYGFGAPQNRVEASQLGDDVGSGGRRQRDQLFSTVLACGLVLAMIAALFVVFAVQKFRSSKKRLLDMTAPMASGGSADYSDLCRQRMTGKATEQEEPHWKTGPCPPSRSMKRDKCDTVSSESPNSSTGSWSEDPIATDMDITTGHLILSYMEKYLNDKEKLELEWAGLVGYEPDRTSCSVAQALENAEKNRYRDLLPYDHTRVVLNKELNSSSGDYINASYICDSDPKVKSYILTQGPTDGTSADFWQMLWESCSITIVNLTKLKSTEGAELCCQYWPSEGSRLFNRFEVHLVSEHIWCESFVVRNFYLKNLSTGEARTVTMFHFLSWDESGLPPTAKALLDFRRKVNKSYKGRSTPLVIHCNDGCGRSGAYCLLDLALSRINKGVKEIDLAACLEHLRDQRDGLVRTKEQFEFVITAIAEEVHNVLKTLPQ